MQVNTLTFLRGFDTIIIYERANHLHNVPLAVCLYSCTHCADTIATPLRLQRPYGYSAPMAVTPMWLLDEPA